MIRLSGLVDLQAIGRPVGSHINEDEADFRDQNDSPDSHMAEPEGNMSKANLLTLHKQVSKLYNMVGESEELEEWVREKIKEASNCINSVFNHLEYEKSGPASIGQGDGAPAGGEDLH